MPTPSLRASWKAHGASRLHKSPRAGVGAPFSGRIALRSGKDLRASAEAGSIWFRPDTIECLVDEPTLSGSPAWMGSVPSCVQKGRPVWMDVGVAHGVCAASPLLCH